MARKFEEWWNTVPADLKQKARKGDESNKPLLNQINYVLLHLHLAGKHDAKPSHDAQHGIYFFLSIEDFTNYQSLTDHIDNQEVEEWHSSQ
jgi:hypothetical protein